jgi:hypothetical protein
LNLKLFLQGFYLGNSTMQPALFNEGVAGSDNTEADSIIVELHSVADPSTIIESENAILATDGSVNVVFHDASSVPYWIAVKHRNSVETWSNNPVTIPANYDFTTSASTAFGNNLVDPMNDGVYCLFTGDINQDSFIDIFDFPEYDADNQNFVSNQYARTDINGDGFVDIFDFPYFDANNQNFVSSVHP